MLRGLHPLCRVQLGLLDLRPLFLAPRVRLVLRPLCRDQQGPLAPHLLFLALRGQQGQGLQVQRALPLLFQGQQGQREQG